MRRWLLALLLGLAAMNAWPQSQPIASAAPLQFQDHAEEQRFRELTEQLRCVMCQNQSLADSNALIAQDLRLEILRLIRSGKTDEQIKQYLVARYTEFVLYQPQVKPTTWLLWFGPALLVIGGALVVVAIVRKHGRDAPASPPANDSKEW